MSGDKHKDQDQSNKKDELIAALKNCGAVKFGDFTLSSGKKSKYYIDIKKASTDPATLRIIAEQATEKIRDLDLDIVGGVALGGVPIATAVSLETGLPLLLVRKDVKDYGTGGRFVGDLTDGARVVLMEDVTTSGGSVLDGISALRDAGGVVDTVITVVDREENAMGKLDSVGVNLIPLVRASDLVVQDIS